MAPKSLTLLAFAIHWAMSDEAPTRNSEWRGAALRTPVEADELKRFGVLQGAMHLPASLPNPGTSRRSLTNAEALPAGATPKSVATSAPRPRLLATPRTTRYSRDSVLAPLVVVAVASIWAVLQRFDAHYISFSDGVYTYIAAAVARSGPAILYHRVVLSQPPGVVLFGAMIWRLSPAVSSIRLALAALLVTTGLLTYALARVLGLGRPAAVVAAAVAVTAPLRAQYGGLDGEAFLSPLALALTILTSRSRTGVAGLLVGLGFLFKLTWAPFALAGLVAIGAEAGPRAALRSAGLAFLSASTLVSIGILAFGWHTGDMLKQAVLGESGSGLQLALLPGILIIVVLSWWSLGIPAMAGRFALDRSSRLMAVAGVFSGLLMLTQGTFLNVLIPLEPFVAIAAVAGTLQLWGRATARNRALAGICMVFVVLHTVSLASGAGRSALPVPIGAAILNTHDGAQIARAAAAVDAGTKPGQRVFVNPLIAVAAHRRELDDQADWFILHAMSRSCQGRGAQCTEWRRLGRAIADAEPAAVGIDANVRSFDPTFASGLPRRRYRAAFRVDAPPLHTVIYVAR